MQCGRALKTKTKPKSKRKTVRPAVRKISPVSIYGEGYGGKDLRKRCVLSLECKRERVIDADRGPDDSVDPTWVIQTGMGSTTP